MYEYREVPWSEGDMRSSRTAADLQRTDRQEHQDAEVEDRKGGARCRPIANVLSGEVHADLYWHATYGLWKLEDVDRTEATLYRRIMRIGNDVPNAVILNTMTNIKLAGEVIYYLSREAWG